MLSLYKSARFQEEYNNFKWRIDRVSDEALKNSLLNNLSKLATFTKNLDSQHEEMIYSGQMKTMSGDMRERIMEVRKSLNKKLSDWERANIKSKQNL